MKNILVTGGCGFIGANFIRLILGRDDFDGRIVNVDTLTYAGNPENLAGLEAQNPGRLFFVQADIRDYAAVDTVFDKFDIDAVCHFAAESHVDRSISGPADFIATNINGTFNLLEAARKRPDQIKLFHHVSTDEVYGSLGPEGYFTEKSPYRPSSPYSASKASSDHLVRAYFKTYGLPVTLSNCSNNYGPFQFPEKLIPLMIANALNDLPLPIYGDGKNVRDWLYVKDHCLAIWAVMRNGVRGRTYAAGGGCERTNIEVASVICRILDRLSPRSGGGSFADLITFVADRPGHDFRYAIDFSRIQKELGWTPAESFETGMEKTVKWNIENQNWAKRALDRSRSVPLKNASKAL
jgi:dTDP-glucose 4,6-dehydratase